MVKIIHPPKNTVEHFFFIILEYYFIGLRKKQIITKSKCRFSGHDSFFELAR